MQIFKFGGASVKDAQGVKNLARVLTTVGYNNTLVIVSAMGKTTNALETVISNYFDAKHQLQSSIQDVKKFHNNILIDLFENEKHAVYDKVDALFREVVQFFDHNKSPNYNFVYDQVIGFGELVSTTIISHYLNEIGLTNTWLDVRNFIKTDNYYRNAKVDWNDTQDLISGRVDASKLNITP
jgi:aspartate kinase